MQLVERRSMSSVDPSPMDMLTAYYQAGIAVVGHVYQIEVQQLRLTRSPRVGQGVRVSPLGAYWLYREDATDRLQPYIDHATVLVAGQVGREIGLVSLGLESDDSYKRHRSQRAAFRAACQLNEPELDLAFAIVFGWLSSLDGSDTMATLARIYRRAQNLLSATLYRDRVDKIVLRLLETRSMDQEDIRRIIEM